MSNRGSGKDVMRGLFVVLSMVVAMVSPAWGRDRCGDQPLAVSSRDGRAPGDMDDERLVGDYGARKCVRIGGVTAFLPAQIRDTLFTDMDVLVAAHPAARRDKYLSLLCRRLRDGYHHAGFADAQTVAALDGRQVLLTVKEGPRYVCDGVVIHSAKMVSVERLAARLSARHRPAWVQCDGDDPSDWEMPVWETGKPAPLDAFTRCELHRQVQAALADLGFPLARFEIYVSPRVGERKADLHVELDDEGAATVSQVEIVGNRRDSRDEILDYLQIRLPCSYGRTDRERIEKLLWHSGRFLSYKITPVQGKNLDHLTLRLELTEYPAAPRLRDPLSLGEQALLRARQWLIHPDRKRCDWVAHVRVEGQEAEVILSPQHGCLVTWRGKPATKDNPPLWAVAGSDRLLAYYDLSARTKVVVPCESRRFVTSLDLTVNAQADSGKDSEHFMLRFGVGSNARQASDPPGAVSLCLRAWPVFFLGLAHEYGATCTSDGRRATIANPGGLRLEIDQATGEIVYWEARDDSTSFRVRWVEGAMAERLRALESSTAAWPNSYDSRCPLNSVLAALWRDPWAWQLVRAMNENIHLYDPQDEPLVALAGRFLLDHGALRPLDDAIVAGWSEPESTAQTFELPDVKIDWSSPEKFMASLPQISLFWADDIFPRNSWAWTLSREYALWWAGHTEYIDGQLHRLAVSNDKGPLGCLLTAALLAMRGAPEFKAAAADGLNRLSTADFRHDYHALVADGHPTAKIAEEIAGILRGADPREIDAILRAMPPVQAALLDKAVRRLRERPHRPAGEAIDAALDEVWSAALRSSVERGLRALAQPEARQPGDLKVNVNSAKL